jgi:predicted 3-demethylubiquinone-9 3-methyltransferase (glyoxalase superfamily)
MQLAGQKISPCLWFDTQAEQAANFYVSVFKDSRVKRIIRYSKAGKEMHRREPGSVLTVEFEIAGQTFLAINGGPQFKFSESVSFQIACQSQDEIDYFWDSLGRGGEEGPCGWLKDKFGLSWQVAPDILPDMLAKHDSEQSQRAMAALMKMKKLDIAALKAAHAGQPS